MKESERRSEYSMERKLTQEEQRKRYVEAHPQSKPESTIKDEPEYRYCSRCGTVAELDNYGQYVCPKCGNKVYDMFEKERKEAKLPIGRCSGCGATYEWNEKYMYEGIKCDLCGKQVFMDIERKLQDFN